MNKESKNDYMKLQDQVCTLEQAKRLKELGIDGPSIFYHTSSGAIYPRHEGALTNSTSPAFTVAELGVVLPVGCQTNYNDHHGYWVCEFIEQWDEEDEPNAKPYAVKGWKLTASIGDDDEPQTEAEARAAMLIYLLENNLTTASECNKRLTT